MMVNAVEYTRARIVNEQTGFVRICGGKDDPWANYRHGRVEDICPEFKPLEGAYDQGWLSHA
jgi:hypothetical protein